MELITTYDTPASQTNTYAYPLTRWGKVCVVGTSCAGKTTLAKELAQQLGLPFVGEVARDLPQGGRNTLEIQDQINLRQGEVENEYGDAVYDSGVVTNLAYITYFSELNDPKSVASISLALEHIIRNPYRYIVFVDEYFTLENDGVRDMDPERQEFIYKTLKHLVTNGFLENWSKVIQVRGSTEERLATIREAMFVGY